MCHSFVFNVIIILTNIDSAFSAHLWIDLLFLIASYLFPLVKLRFTMPIKPVFNLKIYKIPLYKH